MIRVLVHLQDHRVFAHEFEGGDREWRHLEGPLRLELFPSDAGGALVVGNDVGDQGEGGYARIDRIEITGDRALSIVPRAGWKVDGNTLTIGNGAESMQPRGSLRIRWAWGERWEAYFERSNPASWTVQVGRTRVGFPSDVRLAPEIAQRRAGLLHALATGGKQPYVGLQAPDLYEGALGMWHPSGRPLPDWTAGGGDGIEAISGWERDPFLAIQRHDLTMERHAVGWYCADGSKMPTLGTDAGHYSLSRGWASSTQPSSVSKPLDPSNKYDERRIPNGWSAGLCSYEARLAGVDAYNGFLPHDAQHLVRVLRHAKAAAHLWNDPVAQADLEMIAQDAAYGDTQLPGTRSWAWCIDAWVAGGHARRAQKAAKDGIARQMTNGQIMRVSKGYPFIPDAWTASKDVPEPLPEFIDACASMESNFAQHALVSTGNAVPARCVLDEVWALVEMLGYVPKFWGVGVRGSASLSGQNMRWAGKGDYTPHLALGLGAWEGGITEEKLLRGLDIATPNQGVATSLPDLRERLVKDTLGRSQTIAMLAALEEFLG